MSRTAFKGVNKLHLAFGLGEDWNIQALWLDVFRGLHLAFGLGEDWNMWGTVICADVCVAPSLRAG